MACSHGAYGYSLRCSDTDSIPRIYRIGKPQTALPSHVSMRGLPRLSIRCMMSYDTSARAYCTHIAHQIAPALGMTPPEARAVLLELQELATTRAEAATPAQRSGRSTTQDRLAAARARGQDAAAAEATSALFAEMRSMQPPVPVPSHGEIDPATGLALPKPAAQHGWRAVYETVQAARAGRELPALAREIIAASRARSASTPEAVARAALARMPRPRTSPRRRRCSTATALGQSCARRRRRFAMLCRKVAWRSARPGATWRSRSSRLPAFNGVWHVVVM